MLDRALNLSALASITLGLARHSEHITSYVLRLGLAPRKDLAVSFPPFYLYRGTGPATLRSGPPSPFELGRFCSHLYAYARRLLAATLPRLVSKRESGLSSPT